MRDEDTTADELLAEIDVARLAQLVKAMFLANSKVFGKLPGKMQKAVDKISTRLEGKDDADVSPESASPETS